MTFDPKPGLEIQRQQIEQKLNNLRQQHFDADLEVAILDTQEPGIGPEHSRAKLQRLSELKRLKSNAAKGAEAMQQRLDEIMKALEVDQQQKIEAQPPIKIEES